ncbi:MAG: hypothetical protein PUD92_03810, partial [Clostridiales bacterium]|nr:hypothetical protein [Clostridiales bacterium]
AMAQGTTAKVQQTPVTISFDIKVPSGSDEVWGLVCPVMEETENIADTDFGQNHMINITKAADTENVSIAVKDGTDEVIKSINIATDAWYSIVIDENLGGSGNWSYIVAVYDASGNLIDTCSKLGSQFMGTFQNINFTAWRTGAYYVDNIKIDKISRGFLVSDDMEYNSREEASKYWRTGNNAASFEKIDNEHGMTAKVGNTEFYPCIAAEPVESGIVTIDFDTYILGNTNGNQNNCGRFNVINKDGTSDPGGNCILRFDQRSGDSNVDLYVGDNWINQLPSGWYHVSIEMNLDAGSYSVSVKNTNGNDYCSTNSNSQNNTTRAVTNFAMINFTSWADPFYFDNVSITTGDKPAAEFRCENTVTAKYISDDNKATGIKTVISNVGEASGSFVTVIWDITSNNENGRITTIKEGGAKTGNVFSLDAGASIEFGIIIDGLYDENPVVDVILD